MSQRTFINNGYEFTVEDNGTVTAKGRVSENPASRKGMNNIHPDGYNSAETDKGHLIAARAGGPAEDYNVSAQDRTLNRGSYKTVENAELRLANEGNTVETEKIAYVSNPGDKPDAYMVNDTITTPEGETHEIHHSFQNASPQEQQEWEDLAEQYNDYDEYGNPDPARESMSPEEYNALLEEAEETEDSVKDEYDLANTYSYTPADTEGADSANEATNASCTAGNGAGSESDGSSQSVTSGRSESLSGSSASNASSGSSNDDSSGDGCSDSDYSGMGM